jgi:hypothetical protein
MANLRTSSKLGGAIQASPIPLLLAVPALAARAPSAAPSLDQLQDLIKAVPVPLVEGKQGTMRGQVTKAKAA